MKDFINGIIRASGEQWVGFICLVFCACVSGTLVKLWTSDHIVRCYYIKSEMTNAGTAYKVMGDVDWMEDVKSYNTPDGDKALEILASLKQCGK